jgi:hypothetical protein
MHPACDAWGLAAAGGQWHDGAIGAEKPWCSTCHSARGPTAGEEK